MKGRGWSRGISRSGNRGGGLLPLGPGERTPLLGDWACFSGALRRVWSVLPGATLLREEERVTGLERERES